MTHSIHPGELWPDTNGIPVNAHGGGILRFGDFFYWYGEHKGPGEKGNRAFDGVHVYRSRDLLRWEDRGLALDIRNGRIPELPPGCVLERPKALFCAKTGKFVLWYHFEGNQNDYRMAHCGTAVSDSPEGPFVFLWHGRADTGTKPVSMRNAEFSRETMLEHKKIYDILPGSECPEAMNVDYMTIGYFLGQDSRDMTLFQDDDGKAYLIYSSEINSTLHISLLTEDFTGFSGVWERVFIKRWMEAPCIFKHEGRYYFIGSGCTGWAPNAARSAVADHLFGPWTELGNPAIDADGGSTYHSQSTFVLKLEDGLLIYMGDRWNPENAIDGRYVWLPIEWENGRPLLRNRKAWSLI